MELVLTLINAWLFWTAVYAFFKSRKEGTGFFEEFKNAIITTKDFVSGLFGKPDKEMDVKVEENEAAKTVDSMKRVADNLNHQINMMVNYNYPQNRGWKYLNDNWTYLISHGKPAEIEVNVYGNRFIKATVIINNGVVCAIEDSSSKITKRSFHNEQVVSESQAAPATENNVKKNEGETLESTTSETIDAEKAKAIAVNYIADNYEDINNTANQAVAYGADSFILRPDCDGSKIVLEQIGLELERRNFKNIKVNSDGSIEVGINLDAPSDNGNYDFEQDEQDQSQEVDDDDDLFDDKEDEEIIVPPEPSDLPE